MDFSTVQDHERFAEYVKMLEQRARQCRDENIAAREADREYLVAGGDLRWPPGNVSYLALGVVDRDEAIAYIDEWLASLREHLPIEVNDATRASFVLWLEKQGHEAQPHGG